MFHSKESRNLRKSEIAGRTRVRERKGRRRPICGIVASGRLLNRVISVWIVREMHRQDDLALIARLLNREIASLARNRDLRARTHVTGVFRGLQLRHARTGPHRAPPVLTSPRQRYGINCCLILPVGQAHLAEVQGGRRCSSSILARSRARAPAVGLITDNVETVLPVAGMIVSSTSISLATPLNVALCATSVR